MENSIEMNIKVNEYFAGLPFKANDRSSCINLPNSFENKMVCIIPIGYKTKLPKKKYKGAYNIKLKATDIIRKETSTRYKNIAVYLPISLYKVDVLIFEAPPLEYDPLIF